MELLLFVLSILTIAAIIGISMVSFTVAIKALKKVMILEEKYALKPKKQNK